VLAVELDGFCVRELFERDGPVGATHEPRRAEGLAEAFDLWDGVGEGVGVGGERPEVGDFDEDLWIAREGEQEVELVRLVDGAVRHVIDDDGKIGILLDEGFDVG